MGRPNTYVLVGVLLAFVLVFGGFSILQGGLFLDAHEGDTYHHLDILFRMEEGQRPHIDFMTPLGALAFVPVALLMQSGLSVGMAFLWAQLIAALVLLPCVAYAAASRLPRRTAYAFGLFTLGLVLALTYGGAAPGVSVSMHYNRWAWSVTFVMLVIALLPPVRGGRPWIDGLVLGLCGAALLLLKITFFVVLVPIAAIGLISRRDFAALVAALVAGGLALGAATVVWGVSHWTGYLNDLLIVASSDVRPFVGVPFADIIASPRFIGGTIVGGLAVFLLRQAGCRTEGTLLLLLLPAFFYITYQNFGNDPKWLVFIPVLLMALRSKLDGGSFAGIDAPGAAALLSVAAIAIFIPSLANLALSPVSHAGIQSATFLPMVPDEDRRVDVHIRENRAHTMTAEIYLDQRSDIWAKYSEDAGRADPLTINGKTFQHCEIYAGSRAFFSEITDSLVQSGVEEGSQIFTADVLTALWLFGPFEPLQGGAPWYYGNLSGLENADYVLVPKCPFLSSLTGLIVRDIKAAGVNLIEAADTELYMLYKPEL